MCEAGYSGPDCAVVDIGNDSCQNGCGAFGGTKSARGRCWLGKCFCYPGFQGSDCTEVLKLPCPSNEDLGSCSGHGECHYGRCFCDIGFAGKACSTSVGCPGDCSGKGTCHRGRCKCETGYMGANCNSTDLICENNCHGNGACILGSCSCNPGWSGRACAVSSTNLMKGKQEQMHLTDQQATESAVTNPDAENLVHVHQASVDYTIPSGNTATTNEVEKPNQITLSHDILPKETVEKTRPNKAMSEIAKTASKIKGTTASTAPTSMLQIEEVNVPSTNVKTNAATRTCTPFDCSGHGKCHRGTCYCNPGFSGDGCEQVMTCPGNNCHGHGDCSNGKCVCQPGFNGDACEKKDVCAEKCNQRGVCRWGKYFKRCRSNVAVIIVQIVFISAFPFYCLLLNHSFPTNLNSVTNCFKLILSITTLQTTFAHCVRLF